MDLVPKLGAILSMRAVRGVGAIRIGEPLGAHVRRGISARVAVTIPVRTGVAVGSVGMHLMAQRRAILAEHSVCRIGAIGIGAARSAHVRRGIAARVSVAVTMQCGVAMAVAVPVPMNAGVAVAAAMATTEATKMFVATAVATEPAAAVPVTCQCHARR